MSEEVQKTSSSVVAQPKKKRGKLFWTVALLASALAMILTLFGFLHRVATKARDVLRASGYVEEWTEGVDGETLESISYGPCEWNKFDAFFPPQIEEDKSRCAIVYVHGGAWIGGRRRDMHGFARRATKKGYATASIEYLLYKEGENDSFYSIDVVLDEIDAALVKLKETAAERGVTLERVALCGDSAGGHIVSLYAYSRGKTAPVRVAFIAPRVAPIDFHLDSWTPTLRPATLARLVSGMARCDEKITSEQIVKPNAEVEAYINSVSPLFYLTKETATPTVAAYGGKDPLVGTRHATKLTERFRELGARPLSSVEADEDAVVFDTVEFPHSGHMLSDDPDCAQRYNELVWEYADRYLRDARADANASSVDDE